MIFKVSDKETRYSIIPAGFESSMSRFFFSQRMHWQPVLDELENSIKSDPDMFNQVPLDPPIIPLVLSLRMHGISTNMSCAGHIGRQYINPAEDTSPYVQFGQHPLWEKIQERNLEYANKVIPVIHSNLRSQGKLIGTNAELESPLITDVSQLRDELDHQVFSEYAILVYFMEHLRSIESSTEPNFYNTLQLFHEMSLVHALLQDYYQEIPTLKTIIGIAEIKNMTAFLEIKKRSRGQSLNLQQTVINHFADYLLARYLISKNIISLPLQ